MSYLPPVGWADVATKQDLAILGAELRTEINGLRAEMHQGFASQLRWILGTVLTAMVVLTGLFALFVGLVR